MSLVESPAMTGVVSSSTSVGALRLPRTVLVGAGQRHQVGGLVAGFAGRVLICTDARFSATREFAEVAGSLRSHGIEVAWFDETEPELPVDNVMSCAERFQAGTVEAVIGLGGGSCIDMAKVVAVLLEHGGHPRDYYGEFKVPGPGVPVVAIPTTAGTGSEATPVAVLMDPERSMKVGISSPALIPEIAICDPELTLTAPPGLTSAAGADALTHLVESFTAVRRDESDAVSRRVFIGKASLTDAVALEGLALLGRSLTTAYQQPRDLAARADVMAGALAGGVALGTAGTAAAHALQYPIGAITHTAHGLGVGALLPYVMRFNLGERVAEFGQIARVLGAGTTHGDALADARAGILAVDRVLDLIDIPRSLAQLGITYAHVDDVVEQAMTARRLVENNPRALDAEGLRSIVLKAIDGDRTLPDI